MKWSKNNSLLWTLGLAGALSLALFPAVLNAQEPKPAQPDSDEAKNQQKAMEAIKSINALAAAHRLADYGREQKAPELLLAAARVMATVPVQDLKGDEPAKAGAISMDESLRKDAEKLILEARDLAKDLPDQQRETIEALAKLTTTAASERKRMVVGGPRGKNVFIAANTSVSDIFDLYGGFTTMRAFTIFPAPSTGLNIRVDGALTGLNYENASGFGDVTADFQHLPIAKVRVTVTNTGPFNTTVRFVTN